MELNEIIYLENYDQAYEFAERNELLLEEIEVDENGRRRFRFIKNEIYMTEEELLDNFRMLRQIECFEIVNRGKLWYDTLEDGQLDELRQWYHEWLDVTRTKVKPEQPIWLK